jgi:hypothetical protein
MNKKKGKKKKKKNGKSTGLGGVESKIRSLLRVHQSFYLMNSRCCIFFSLFSCAVSSVAGDAVAVNTNYTESP